MRFKWSIYCGQGVAYSLCIALSSVVDQLCTTNRFVDHIARNMIDKLVCVSPMHDKPRCVSQNGKYEPQSDCCAFCALLRLKNSRQFAFIRG